MGHVVAWRRISDFSTYAFSLSPGDHQLKVGSEPDVSVHVDAGADVTQDLDTCP